MSSRFRRKHAMVLVVGIVVVGTVSAGVAHAAFPEDSVASYAGCLNTSLSPGGTFVNMAVGDTPSKACKSGQVLVHISGGDITAVNAGTGLAGGSSNGATTLSLAQGQALPQTCTNGEVPKWGGTAWSCGTDNDTTYSNGTGLGLSGTTFSVSPGYRLPQTCAGGQVAKWDSASSSWLCGNDADSGLPHMYFTRRPNDWAASGPGIISDQDNVLLSLSVPEGTYSLTAAVRTFDGDHQADTACNLRVNGTTVDQMATKTESFGLNADNFYGSATGQGYANLTGPGTIDVNCTTGDDGVELSDGTLSALRVGVVN
jgi:hypothetical protein